MWNDLGEYIANHCDYKNKDNIDGFNNKSNVYNAPCKVVEIAIGKFFSVADYLTNNPLVEDFSATDINPNDSNILFDDITNPNMDIYECANIIYSIRPPQELQPYIANIANKTGATLIIKPFFNEDLNANIKMKLVNYKKATFYQSI
ncbi:MAG: hypothetical protein FWE58_01855 [Methanobrevibacter sp.]|nr:hypothetical protein [Methanobrevibacter sp.]